MNANDPRFAGLYQATPCTLSARSPEEASTSAEALDDAELSEAISHLYEDVPVLLQARDSARADLVTLYQALRRGRAKVTLHAEVLEGATIRERATQTREAVLMAEGALIAEVHEIRGRVAEVARRLGPGWAARHHHAVAALHVAEHAAAALTDIEQTLDLVIARGSRPGLSPSSQALYELWHDSTDLVTALGDHLGLVPALDAPEVVGAEDDWLVKFRERVRERGFTSRARASEALEHLLDVEKALQREWPDGDDVEDDPSPVPAPVLALREPGWDIGELPSPPRRKKGFTGRQQMMVVGAVIALGALVPLGRYLYEMDYDLVIYNGSAGMGQVTVDGEVYTLGPRQSRNLSFWTAEEVQIEGEIEGLQTPPFTLELRAQGEEAGLYNLGRAGVFVRYQEVWSTGGNVESDLPPDIIGNPVFTPVDAFYVLTPPPEEVRLSGDDVMRRWVFTDMRSEVPLEDIAATVSPEDFGALAETLLWTQPPDADTPMLLAAVPPERHAALGDRFVALDDSLHAHRARQLALGDHPGLVPEYQARAEASGSADDLYLWARLVEDPAEATPLYDRALEKDPQHGMSVCARASNLAQTGSYELAHEAYGRCAELVPERARELVSDRLTVARAIGASPQETLDDTDPAQSIWKLLFELEADPGMIDTMEGLDESWRPTLLYIAGHDAEALAAGRDRLEENADLTLFAAVTLDDRDAIEALLEAVPPGPEGVYYAVAARTFEHASAAARIAALDPEIQDFISQIGADTTSLPASWSLSRQGMGWRLAALAGSNTAREHAKRLTLPGFGVRY